MKRISSALAFTGEPTLAVTSNGVATLRGLSSSAKAKNAVRPFERVVVRPELVGAGVGATTNHK